MLNEEHTWHHCELADSNVSMVYQLTITVSVLGCVGSRCVSRPLTMRSTDTISRAPRPPSIQGLTGRGRARGTRRAGDFSNSIGFMLPSVLYSFKSPAGCWRTKKFHLLISENFRASLSCSKRNDVISIQ